MAKPISKILLVADYGKDDLAFKEVTQRLYEFAEQMGEHVQVDIVSVDSFNTAQTAAVVAQAARGGQYDMIYHNTAPRKDAKHARDNNDGEPLAYAEHQASNGKTVKIVGVFAADESGINTFAMLEHGKVRKLKCDTKGSQFRSRDIFPYHVIAALSDKAELEKQLSVPEIPAGSTTTEEKAKQLLAESGHQLSRHGNAEKKYVTVIGPRNKSVALMLEAIEQFGAEAEIDMLPLKFDKAPWLEAGFAAAQLALNSEQRRRRAIVALTGNGDERYVAVLDNGATVETDDLRVLSFVKPRVLRQDVRDATKSGLRVQRADGRFAAVSRDAIPPLPDQPTIAYVDGYGNIKLAVPRDQILDMIGKDGSERDNGRDVVVRIGGHEHKALITGGSFTVNQGEMALSRGSSGWAKRYEERGEEPQDHFAEIFLRGGSAAQAFNHPVSGDTVDIAFQRNWERTASVASGASGPSV